MSDRLSVSEAAKRAGCSVSTMRRWLSEGRLEGHRSGKKWMVESDHLRSFLSAQCPTVGDRRAVNKLQSSAHDELLVELKRSLSLERERSRNLEIDRQRLEQKVEALMVENHDLKLLGGEVSTKKGFKNQFIGSVRGVVNKVLDKIE